MLSVLRAARLPPPLSQSSQAYSAARKTATIRCFGKGQPTAQEPMETISQEDAAAESQPESFGIAYSTRCEEEGFGGTYAGPPPRPRRESPAAAEPPPGCVEVKQREAHEAQEEMEKTTAPRPN